MIFNKFFNNSTPNSMATKMRKRRFSLFISWLSACQTESLRILDIGGTGTYWKMMEFDRNPNIQITIVNNSGMPSNRNIFTYLLGDGCHLGFADKSFDVVFSNSVIEHVGDKDSQKKMAEEIIRVGKNFFIQTPNKGFFLEPHFLFPFFQFLPTKVQVSLVMHFKLGWFSRQTTIEDARRIVTSVRLLTKNEFIALFPNSTCYTEKLLGMSKSFIVYNEEFKL